MQQQDDPVTKEALDAAANAIKRGDLRTGKSGLEWVLEREPDNILAWLWMSRCVDTDDAKLECFNHVLAVDPHNKHALEGVTRFGGGGGWPVPPGEPASTTAGPSRASKASQPKSRVPLLVGASGLLVATVLCVCFVAVLRRSPSLADTAGTEVAVPTSVEPGLETLPVIELPSETPSPREAPTATNSPPPTETPLPTSTPKPTATVTPLPEPVSYSGRGDGIVEVDKPHDAMIAHITGNSCGRHFSIWSIDANNEELNLLVNTTDPYEGTVALDFFESEWTRRFEIDSSCGWEISVMPLLMARKLEVPGTATGSGDDIIVLTGGTPDLAFITGNSTSRHFAVWGYGTASDLLVNTTDPYDGAVLIDSGIAVLEISAEDDWRIEVTAR